MTDKGVSDIIAVILLISIVTAAMGIVGVMVTRDIVTTNIPHMNFEACIKGGTVYLYHTGGESLNPKESDADFYLNFLDLNNQIIKTIKLMPWDDDIWSAGQVRNVSTEMHPTMDPSIKYVQIVAKPAGGGENLIQWTQAGSCNGTPYSSGPGCLARAYADYSYSPDSSNPLIIQFTDKSQSDDPAYPITLKEWDFGDGTTVTNSTLSFSHTYAKSGNYTVRLRVHNACGSDEYSHLIQVGTCSSTVTASLKTDPNPPQSLNGTPLTVTISDNNSTSIGSTISQYEWDFGDGTTGVGVGPFTKTYSYGIYYVRLTVVDECGNWATDSIQVTVTTESDCAISAAISPEPSSGKTPLEVTFYDNSTTTRGWVNSWLWTFEDNTTSSDQGPHTRTYENPGPGDKTYTIYLTAGNTCGATGTASTTITVSPPCENVTADFSYSINSYYPLNISFIDSSTTGEDLDITDYLWDFGDGTTSSEKDPTHVYSEVNEYTVSLTATNECGLSDTTSKTITFDCYNTITPTAGAGGSISPSDPVSVICGANQSFIITSNSCYNISDIIINSSLNLGQVQSPYIYNFTRVLSDQTINAQFAPVTYYINATAGNYGSISPSGTAIPVTCGSSKTFTITANSCYRIQSIIIDDTTFNVTTETNTTTFDSIDKNHVIRAEFTGKTFNINTIVNPSDTGTITPAGPLTVTCGNSKIFTIEPASCYSLTEVKVNGSVRCSGSQCSNPYHLTLSEIMYDQTILANFTQNGPSIITASAYYLMPGYVYVTAPAGTITPTPACSNPCSVVCGNSQGYTMVDSFTVNRNTYELADIFIDGEPIGITNPYTFTNVQQDHTIVAYYGPKCYFAEGYVTNLTTGQPIDHVRVELYDRQKQNLLWYAYTQSNGHYIIPVMLNNGDKYNMYIGNNTPSWKTMISHLYYDGQDAGNISDVWRDGIVLNPGGKCKTYLDWFGTT